MHTSAIQVRLEPQGGFGVSPRASSAIAGWSGTLEAMASYVAEAGEFTRDTKYIETRITAPVSASQTTTLHACVDESMPATRTATR